MKNYLDFEGEAYIYGQIPEQGDEIASAYLDTLFVPSELRRQGVGRYLLMKFLGRCIASGAERVWAGFRPNPGEDANDVRVFSENRGFHFYENEEGQLCLEKELQ